jgi:hypothetical protein
VPRRKRISSVISICVSSLLSPTPLLIYILTIVGRFGMSNKALLSGKGYQRKGQGWLVDEDGDWGTLAEVDPSHPCYARFHSAYRGGQWWTSRGYDPTFGRKLPVYMARVLITATLSTLFSALFDPLGQLGITQQLVHVLHEPYVSKRRSRSRLPDFVSKA